MADNLKVRVDANARPIRFELDGRNWTLEITRNVAEWLEDSGYSAEDYRRMPLKMTRKMIHALFRAHHNIKPDFAETIFSRIKNRQDVIAAGNDMYADCINSLLANDEDEDDFSNNAEGNADETQEA